MRYFPLIASVAFLAADSFPVSATYQNSSLQIFSGSQQSQPNLDNRKGSQQAVQNKNNYHLFAQLNLSSEQKQQIKQIHNQYQTKISQQRHKLQILQQELVKMMTSEDSAQLIRAKHQEILQLRQQLDQLQFESLLATREVLTPSQRQQFTQIMESRRIKS